MLEKQTAFSSLGACVNNSWSSVSRLYFVFVYTVYTYTDLELLIRVTLVPFFCIHVSFFVICYTGKGDKVNILILFKKCVE